MIESTCNREIGPTCASGPDVIHCGEKTSRVRWWRIAPLPLFRRRQTRFELRYNKPAYQGIFGSLILCDGVRI
ncbi:hypothetical protein N8H74_26105 [Pseudomonas sp. B2M1-30]|uniref:hypothetical protein n=1 Tax=Pseudomonas TaxID=286 RepID=UPI0021C6A824|nr:MULTISPECIES: hypothetical protein [Pseudomonas]MCU0121749.1 hypothetical protein [Pseudomonas sp. B2M1-30]MCU7263863.1 hypothetical protein [Pseudomonas koreensis]